jgi:hypothetical protein
MALLSLPQIDAIERRAYGARLTTKTARAIFSEDRNKHPRDYRFDIFLSHSYNDARLNPDRLLGIKGFFEMSGYEVYVDSMIDTQLNREQVTKETAQTLRARMDHSRCLVFATSETSQTSKWMPWELGYKDGCTGKNGLVGTVAILPIAQGASETTYKGQEYLGIYPYLDYTESNGKTSIWVNEGPNVYCHFHRWLDGEKPSKH